MPPSRAAGETVTTGPRPAQGACGRPSPSRTRLLLLVVLLASGAGVLAPRAALATQGAELYRTQAHFYGRFEARLRFAPGEGVVSSFFLWRDGSSSTTSWNELDYEKIDASCKLTTNIWTGKGTQSSETNTTSFDVCADYHTYAFEWTADYIAWLIDGTQIRKVTGASVAEYTQNASQGMSMHFNVWAGNSSFGGTLNPSTLPVRQFISWVQYSSYSAGSFQLQWREDFDAAAMPDGWLAGTWESPYNLSTHNPANVTFANGIAVLSMTADTATGFTGTPPVDPAGGGGGGASGAGGASGPGGRNGAGGAGSGGAVNGGAPGSGSGGSASSGAGGMSSAGSGGNGPTGSGGSASSGGATGSGSGGSGGSSGSSGSSGSMTGSSGRTDVGSGGSGGSTTGSGGTSGSASGGSGGSMTSSSGGTTGSGGTSASGGSSGSGGSQTQNPKGSGGAGSPAQSGSGGGCDVGSSHGAGEIAALLLMAGLLGWGRARKGPSRTPR